MFINKWGCETPCLGVVASPASRCSTLTHSLQSVSDHTLFSLTDSSVWLLATAGENSILTQFPNYDSVIHARLCQKNQD